MTSRLLLDSNVFLWSLQDRGLERLSARARAAITTAPEVLVSIASPWELMIKAAKDRLVLPEDLESRGQAAGYVLLPIKWKDARLAAALPRLHKDPFDRIIVAQAFNYDATVLTSDSLFHAYGVKALMT